MEGLTAMAVEIPEDDVEFLGKYLLEYASRQRKAEKIQAELLAVENKYADYVTSEEMKAKSAAEKDATASQKANAYSRFISDIQTVFNNKTDMMYSVVEYIEGQMDIPAAYIAIKTTVGENEILNYVVASPSQKFMEGKKLAKPPADEGEEAPPRQGIAFEAFKLPEVPEEEEAGDEETKVAKEPPKPLPVVIDNAMRDKRCKFFGIPKLGAFAAIPFTYQSVDHENGCIMSAGEEEKPAEYTINKMPIQFIIGIDSVGKYRIFKVSIMIV